AIAAEIPTAEPALSQAQALLSRPFVVVVDDPLTGDPELGGFHTEFSADPSEIGGWLRPLRRRGQITLNFDTRAVRDWVQGLAPQVGEGRVLEADKTAARVLETLRAGATNRVVALVSHPPSTYTVQAGDTFFDIAYNHGFPQWRLEQANPDVDPGLIDIGQELVIPSIDVLFPYPLVPDKRIEIDLPTQTLRAFDGDAQRFEFKVSSGISTTPTLAGQFQILFKEEMAFAQRWHLDMPYFMAFYAEREDFFNGIHELPITSYGTRLSPYVLGWPASYGCIILNVDDAAALYHWADIGTLVRVEGVAPGTPFGQQTLLDIAPVVEEPAP
ncbi:MAG: L,D-transpeptidase family protein, partial [Anaerolineae bacterium]|nr:L,D-transpeptidase family protein [Anaerolineae bacterium]